MISSPEVPKFNADAFDENFFAAYEEQLSDISVEEQASLALAEVLTIEKADGTQKTYEEIKQDTQTFFANDWVRNDEMLLNRMAAEFAQACMGHGHGSALAGDGRLGSIFEKGADGLFGDGHGHAEGLLGKHDHEDETDPKTGKKKKKRGWFGAYL